MSTEHAEHVRQAKARYSQALHVVTQAERHLAETEREAEQARQDFEDAKAGNAPARA